jgi:ketosteroid isomerase-like protein
MSEANKKLVTKLIENLTSGLLDKAFDAVTDDATWWVAGTPEPYTKQQYRDLCGYNARKVIQSTL